MPSYLESRNRPGNACDLPFDNHFDLVTCIDILEHIENDEHAIASIYNSLAPGGTLVLHVPAKYRRFPVFKKQINPPVAKK